MPSPAPPHRPSIVADRAVSILVVGTLALFLGLVGLCIYLVARVDDVAGGNRVAQDDAKAATIASCQQSNANRSEDMRLWTAVLALPPGATAAQKAQAARDLALAHKAFALRDCSTSGG